MLAQFLFSIFFVCLYFYFQLNMSFLFLLRWFVCIFLVFCFLSLNLTLTCLFSTTKAYWFVFFFFKCFSIQYLFFFSLFVFVCLVNIERKFEICHHSCVCVLKNTLHAKGGEEKVFLQCKQTKASIPKSKKRRIKRNKKKCTCLRNNITSHT